MLRVCSFLIILLCSLNSFAEMPVFERGWPILKVGERPVTQAVSGAPVNVSTDSVQLLNNDYTAPQIVAGTNSITLVYSTDKGRLEDCWAPFPALGEQAWKRSLQYTNTTNETQDILGMRMMTAPRLPDEAETWNPRTFWMGGVTPERSVCLSYLSDSDTYAIAQGGDGRIGHQVHVHWRLMSGETAEVGVQGIWLGENGTEAFRDEARRWYRAMDLTAAPVPEWLHSAILYECNAGGHIDSRFSDVGGFRTFAQQVPYLAELGVTAVWLQSVYSHKTLPNPTKGGWNLYGPLDFDVIDAIMGGTDGLQALMEVFHAEGIHVLGETVPHGYVSKQAEALPQWWTRKRDGELSNNWGGRGMDYASPEWQAVMAASMGRLATEFGMEGCRIDVADGSGANWGSPRTPHASYSTLGGALELQAALYEAMTVDGVPPVLIPESQERPEYFRYSALGYGWDTVNLMSQTIPQHIGTPAEMVRLLTEHFERERGSLPPGALVLRTLNNHDTVCHIGRVQERYGAGLHRALYGVCLMVPGVPMLYQEEEVGSFDALKALHDARRKIPAFHTGEASYDTVQFAPEVFSVFRWDGSGYAIGMANLSGKRISGSVRLDLPDSADTVLAWMDEVSKLKTPMRGDGFHWTLESYAVAMLRSVDLARPHSPQASLDTAPSPIEVEDGNRVQFGAMECRWQFPHQALVTESRFAMTFDPATTAPPQMRIRGAKQWLVSGTTALLQDVVQPRHFPFPADMGYVWAPKDRWGHAPNHLYHGQSPTGRLWQSLLEPLHPDAPNIAFIDRDGHALILKGIDSTAQNCVLSMHRDETGAETGDLLLTFYPDDPAIHPRVKALGRNQPWQMASVAPPAPVKQYLAFSMEGATEPQALAICTADRLPYQPAGSRLVLDTPESTHFHNAYWLIQPGELRWENLAPVTGRYRIRLGLRHSERSATDTEMDDAYEVRLNGEQVPLEWGKRNTFNTGNAYFGHALTPPVDLSGEPHTLSIRTTKTWCAITENVFLIAEK